MKPSGLSGMILGVGSPSAAHLAPNRVSKNARISAASPALFANPIRHRLKPVIRGCSHFWPESMAIIRKVIPVKAEGFRPVG